MFFQKRNFGKESLVRIHSKIPPVYRELVAAQEFEGEVRMKPLLFSVELAAAHMQSRKETVLSRCFF